MYLKYTKVQCVLWECWLRLCYSSQGNNNRGRSTLLSSAPTSRPCNLYHKQWWKKEGNQKGMKASAGTKAQIRKRKEWKKTRLSGVEGTEEVYGFKRKSLWSLVGLPWKGSHIFLIGPLPGRPPIPNSFSLGHVLSSLLYLVVERRA